MRIEWAHVNKRFYDATASNRPFRQDAKMGLLDFTTSVRSGITVVLGPGGAGKSTLLRVTAGALVPDDGRVTYHTDRNEVQVWSKSVAALNNPAATDPLRKQIGFVPKQKQLTLRKTMEEHLHEIARLNHLPRSKSQIGALIAKWGLAAYRKKPLGELSPAVSARYTLARSLLCDPAIWLLDEPGDGLDSLGWHLLNKELSHRRHKGLVLLATNDLTLAEVADYLLLMENGSCRRLGEKKYLAASVPDGTVTSWYDAMQTFMPARRRFT